MNPLYGPDNLPPDQLTISVTADHIARGVKQDCSACAAGLALHEQYPLEVGWWSISDAVRYHNLGVERKRWHMTLELEMFIDAFDSGRPVEPATFVLDAVK